MKYSNITLSIIILSLTHGVYAMQKDYTVQAFRQGFEEQIIELISHIQQIEFNIAITPEQQPDLKNIAQVYQQRKGNFWVALHNNTVIGTIALMDIGNNQAALRKMFVHKDYRGKESGVAIKLLDTLLTWAKAQGITSVYLGTTAAFLAAHRFYEKNGFIEIQPDQLPQAFSIMGVDSKFYKYNL